MRSRNHLPNILQYLNDAKFAQEKQLFIKDFYFKKGEN